VAEFERITVTLGQLPYPVERVPSVPPPGYARAYHLGQAIARTVAALSGGAGRPWQLPRKVVFR
jgi:hypothetical protein